MRIFIKALLFILVFALSSFIFFMSTYPYDIEGFSHGARLLVVFIVTSLLVYGSLRWFGARLTQRVLLIAVILPAVLVIIWYWNMTSWRNMIKVSPLYITWALAIVTGVFWNREGIKAKRLVVLALFPVIMSLGVYDLHRHWMEYGNLDGVVDHPKQISFEFIDKAGNRIGSADLKGKIVWLDFWFVACPPCWKQFPHVQEIYDKRKGNKDFALYAVNRGDDPEKLFSRIEDKGYSFPVLRGEGDEIAELGVSSFPTILLLNENGEVVFQGELEQAKLMLEELLNE